MPTSDDSDLMPTSDDSDRSAPIRVGLADYDVSEDNPLSTTGLGSCLGIALYDASTNVGGLVHPMLPYRPEGSDRPPAAYVDSGITTVLDAMERHGAAQPRIVAKIAGGAAMLEVATDEPIGERNLEAARTVLDRLGIDIVATDVGESCGRTVTLDPRSGEFEVKRAGDGTRHL